MPATHILLYALRNYLYIVCLSICEHTMVFMHLYISSHGSTVASRYMARSSPSFSQARFALCVSFFVFWLHQCWVHAFHVPITQQLHPHLEQINKLNILQKAQFHSIRTIPQRIQEHSVAYATTRTGILLPADVAAFGRAVVHHAHNHTVIMELWLPGLNTSQICCSFREIGSPLLPPMLVVIAAKNHLVGLWEKRYFKTRRVNEKHSEATEEFPFIQRGYRLPRLGALDQVTAKYCDGMLQITIPPLAKGESQALLPYTVEIRETKAMQPVNLTYNEYVESSWIFNWDKFPELYNLENDHSKLNLRNASKQ